MDSLFTAWLPQHTNDGQDPVANADWKSSASSAPSASTASTVGQPALEVPEFSLGADLPAASSSSPQANGFFPYTQQPHATFWSGPATYNYVNPSWSAQPSQLPLSSYSSLNGATSTQGSGGGSSQMVIDPALTINGQHGRSTPIMSPGNFLSSQGQQLQFSYNQSPHTPSLSINPSFVHSTPSHFQIPHQNNRTILSHGSSSSPLHGALSSYGTLSDSNGSPSIMPPPSMFTFPPASPAAPAPTPEQLKEKLLANIRPFLQPSSFSGAGAVAHLAEFVKEFGVQEVDPQVRLEIATKIRDNAGNHYFRAWLENPVAMEITQEWLRACVGKEDLALVETIMPLLQILDRLPISVNSLRNNKLGKIVVRLGKEAPTSAIKDMASNLERKWRMLLVGQNPKETEVESAEDAATKKRKTDTAAAKAGPPPKRVAVSTPSSSKPVVKKEAKPTGKEVKESKSDSSFFSTPKPKPKLPSFKKAPPVPVVKKEPEPVNVAQPSSANAFQEALMLMGPKGKQNSPMPTSVSPPTISTVTPPAVVVIAKPNKKGKSVTWAPEGKLEMVKIIERAIYDDDPAEGSFVTHNLRDLDRGEGAALHAHVKFEEQVDWSEPSLLEIPPELDIPERGKDSQEKSTQEEREQSALVALYMSPLQIPESPAEPANVLPEEQVDQDVRKMMTGDADTIFWNGETQPTMPEYNPSVAELVGQLSADVAMSDSFGVQSFNLNPSTLASLPGLSQIAAPDLQQIVQHAQAVLFQQQSPAYLPGMPAAQGGPEQSYADYERGLNDDGRAERRWSSEESWYERGNGRGRGRGRGRGGFRQTRRKPCTFFAAGRCKYGDQCDFSHEPIQ
ncbi:hypothetical protein BXZ70DRAFT_919222 [Cristinia sonorae]|uniref:Serine/threonine-protein phosphatase 1 regulatory subunit 10 n=1 Tax=Cristinia sonorae TaxID=1940300 RepID=A0A8K0UWF8_9AGAR|nr:hypothetical protein BXZ70DRAFT_919222 [Cristinia sonorae]